VVQSAASIELKLILSSIQQSGGRIVQGWGTTVGAFSKELVFIKVLLGVAHENLKAKGAFFKSSKMILAIFLVFTPFGNENIHTTSSDRLHSALDAHVHP
jgi:hypothetical protein